MDKNLLPKGAAWGKPVAWEERFPKRLSSYRPCSKLLILP
jgi:hypothetical protein